MAKNMNITKRQRLAGNAVQKCRNGDSISDDELNAGISVLKELIPALHAMGDCYYLAFADLNQRLYVLEGFKQSRKSHR